MERPALYDPDTYPTDNIIASTLKSAHAAFNALFEYNHEKFPEFEEKWKYYHDGKSWLMNVSYKRKTLFWLSVGNGLFRTSFYLNKKAARLVRDSKLGNDYKKAFMDKIENRLIGLTVAIKSANDIEEYKELLHIKMQMM